MEKKAVEFLRKKDYKFIRDIGQGGLGITILLRDEIIDEHFVCKKYFPIAEQLKQFYFKNFVDEIKLLHKIYHNNIVRIFNYYLYPEKTTGYILMEFIDGYNIKDFSKENPHLISNLFEQVITGFCHLEENNILHRDIRPANILVSKDGIVKIIDFGFGKTINFENDYDKSISINWRFSPPQDFDHQFYNHCTEIYFVGKLFEEIILEHQIEDFIYKDIISEMTKLNFNERIREFRFVQDRISAKDKNTLEFSFQQKEVYKNFAYSLTEIFSKIEENAIYLNEIPKIINGLDIVLKNSLLEDYIQNTNAIAKNFVSGNYRYYRNVKFPVSELKDFINLMKSMSIDKQKIILNNLWQRLDTVVRYSLVDEDGLPF